MIFSVSMKVLNVVNELMDIGAYDSPLTFRPILKFGFRSTSALPPCDIGVPSVSVATNK